MASEQDTVQEYQTSIDGHRQSLPGVAAALSPEAAEATGKALKGRVVVVTGAGSGFGRDFAKKAAAFGSVSSVSAIAGWQSTPWRDGQLQTADDQCASAEPRW